MIAPVKFREKLGKTETVCVDAFLDCLVSVVQKCYLPKET